MSNEKGTLAIVEAVGLGAVEAERRQTWLAARPNQRGAVSLADMAGDKAQLKGVRWQRDLAWPCRRHGRLLPEEDLTAPRPMNVNIFLCLNHQSLDYLGL
jgi:hypothetical protein